MKTMNRVFLMGNLGVKPELRHSKAGKPYARLSVATRRYRGPEQEETTEWHSVFVFGEEAERCSKWLDRGAQVFVEGALSYWKLDKEGETEYRNAINAERVSYISYGKSPGNAMDVENLDNHSTPRNHNAVAHL